MTKPRVVIVGAGFAGYHAAPTLCRLAGGGPRSCCVNPTDYFLYLPLLPEVAAGSSTRAGSRSRCRHPARGTAACWARSTGVDLDARRVALHRRRGRTRASSATTGWSSPSGSVNKLLPIPGRGRARARLPGPARGAVPARPHDPADRAGRRGRRPGRAQARCTFVVVGAGLHRHRGGRPRRAVHRRAARAAPAAGRRAAAVAAARRAPTGCCPSWTRGCPRTADRVLRGAASTSARAPRSSEATADGVQLTDGAFVPTRTLVWCVGRPARPAREPTWACPPEQGRLVVDEYLHRARPPRGLRLRRRRRGAGPDPARPVHRR